MHALSAADAAYAPTEWQRRQVPEEYRAKVSVVHDGIDTDRVRPDAHARFSVAGQGLRFEPGDEVLTFINRNLEALPGLPRLHAGLAGDPGGQAAGALQCWWVAMT